MSRFIALRSSCFTVLIVFLATATLLSQNDVKKIKILESNNYYVSSKYKRLVLAPDVSAPELVQVREYVSSKVAMKGMRDTQQIFRIAAWFHSIMRHNGGIQPPQSFNHLDLLRLSESGLQTLRCQDMAQLLSDVLVAFGHVSRPVAIQTRDAAYGMAGSGHVVTEVWSNDVRAWIMIDPQFGVVCKNKDTFLNTYAILTRTDDMRVQRLSTITGLTKAMTGDTLPAWYKNFIRSYNGSIQMQMLKHGTVLYTMILGLRNHDQYLTFQGLPIDNTMFTTSYEDLYFDVNRVMLFFSYINHPEQQTEVFTKPHTLQEHQQALRRFAAKPEYTVHFEQTMPWIKSIALSLNDTESSVITSFDDDLPILLKPSINTVVATPLNKLGIAGLITKMKIFYGSDQEFDKYVMAGSTYIK
ncbi:MAG: hypothetical protein JNL32_07085 [Candidatus Kapabacteria bacterium]|nr:hypothetical protein [Candidatus Kapabacteria bacterium]